MKKLLSIIILSFLYSNTVLATMYTNHYLDLKNNTNKETKEIREYTLKIALMGMANAYIHINHELKKIRNGDNFFCLPKNFPLNTKNITSIIDTQLKIDKNNGMDVSKWPVHVFLFEGLKQTFPCK